MAMRFGPAGYPEGSKNPKDGMDTVRSLGLDALEVEFVRGVRISEEKARANGVLARERGIRLSAHAPYFISFNSDKQETRDRSVEYVVDTARAAHLMGAYIIVIHAASYGKSPDTATDSVIDGLNRCKEILDSEGIRDVTLGIETMGKLGQWGTLKEISKVMEQVDGTAPVLDVAHTHARFHGSLRTEQDCRDLLDEFFPLAGDIAHFHISCIKYGDKGEISHLPLSAADPDMSVFARAVEGYDRECTFICESPLQEKDAVVFRDMFARR
ncbi:MAG: TIM barrel protein [Candidatus Methanomethylophilaceae archaeon]